LPFTSSQERIARAIAAVPTSRMRHRSSTSAWACGAATCLAEAATRRSSHQYSKAAAKDFRIVMLDQRGTGLSSPIDRRTLPLRGSDLDQARYLEHFRADSIVADAEAIRRALGAGPWTRGQVGLRVLRPLRATRGRIERDHFTVACCRVENAAIEREA